MKISIKWFIFLAFTLLIILSVGFIITSSYQTSKNSILNHAKGVIENIITFSTDKAINHISIAKDASELTSNLAKQKILSSENFGKMEEYFVEQLKVHKQFFNIYYGNISGEFLMVSRDISDENIFFIKKIFYKNGQKTTETISKDINTKELSHQYLTNDNFDPRVRIVVYTK